VRKNEQAVDAVLTFQVELEVNAVDLVRNCTERREEQWFANHNQKDYTDALPLFYCSFIPLSFHRHLIQAEKRRNKENSEDNKRDQSREQITELIYFFFDRKKSKRFLPHQDTQQQQSKQSHIKMSFMKKTGKALADVIPGLGHFTYDATVGKVFITSGSGVVGYRVACSLLEAGHKDVRVGMWKGDRDGQDRNFGQLCADELAAKGAEVIDFDWTNEDGT
jgi:hypothetical protein